MFCGVRLTLMGNAAVEKLAVKKHAAKKLAVIGAGAWGTAIAILLAQNGHEVRLWARRDEFAKQVQRERVNKTYLPDMQFPDSLENSLEVSSDLAFVVDGCVAAFVVVPSKGLEPTLQTLSQSNPPNYIINATKGINPNTLEPYSQLIKNHLPKATLAALSGPNLAQEIGQALPTATTIASEDVLFAKNVQRWLHQKNFRVYASNDILGVELGGALKNVIAIAAGMCDSLNMGTNAKSTLITRGLAEMLRVCEHMGARRESLFGLAGLGDLIATCHGPLSRNYRVGEFLAQGKQLHEIQAIGLTAEGISTCEAVWNYANKHQLDLPITHEVYEVIFRRKSPEAAVSALMLREQAQEVY